MSIEAQRMYYTTQEAAEKWNVEPQWLRRMAREKYVPQRLFSQGYVFHHTDEAIVKALHQRTSRTLPAVPDYADMPPQIVGYSIGQVAEKAGVSMRRMTALVNSGYIQPVQQLYDTPMFTEDAIERVRNAPERSRKRKDVAEMAIDVEYKRGVQPLTEREKDILDLYQDGKGMSVREIGAKFGISGSAVHYQIKRAKVKQMLLDSGKPLAEIVPQKAKSTRLNTTDTEIMRRVLDGKSNAEIAAEFAKSGITDGMVQRRMRKWAETAERETGTPHDRIMTAAYVLAKFGVLHRERTAA